MARTPRVIIVLDPLSIHPQNVTDQKQPLSLAVEMFYTALQDFPFLGHVPLYNLSVIVYYPLLIG